MPATKRILVVYYSLSGNTERVARDLARILDADLEQIREHTWRRGFLGHVRAVIDTLRERPARVFGPVKDPGAYSLVIVGTPVWAGRITPAARTYLESIRDRAAGIACFTTSGGPAPGKLAPGIEALIGRKIAACGGFSQRDLRDLAIYEHKRDAFVAAIKLRPMRRATDTGVAHAHA